MNLIIIAPDRDNLDVQPRGQLDPIAVERDEGEGEQYLWHGIGEEYRSFLLSGVAFHDDKRAGQYACHERTTRMRRACTRTVARLRARAERGMRACRIDLAFPGRHVIWGGIIKQGVGERRRLGHRVIGCGIITLGSGQLCDAI